MRALPVNLLEENADVQLIIDLCDEVKREYGDIAMIIVDTLSRSMPGGDENSPASSTAVISACDKTWTQKLVGIAHCVLLWKLR
jgi:hypothetical protein